MINTIKLTIDQLTPNWLGSSLLSEDSDGELGASVETSGGGGVSLGGLLLRLDAGVTRRVELAGGEVEF